MEEKSPGVDALEELTEEHQAVLSHLGTLDGALVRLVKDETGVDSEALSAVGAVTQLLETDLGLHLRKEEEVLFPALAACLGQEGGPIGVMLMEHEDLRRSLRALSTAFGALQADPRSASPEEVRQVGYGLIGLLRQHIKKEDHMLFPMAGSSLDRGQLLALGEQMRAMA